MSLFPKIQSPCPYKGKFADIMTGNKCRLCKRTVTDLTDMEEGERQEFLAACDGEVCVSYRVGAKSALAAMAMSTVAVPSVAAAQDSADHAPAQTTDQAEAEADEELFYIIVGGMRKPGDAKWVKDQPVSEKPELPTEYVDAPLAKDKDKAAGKAKPARTT